MKAVIIVSTHNRRDLTGITLDAIMACKRPETPVWVVDDYSTEYDEDWLLSFGVKRVVKPPNIRTFSGRHRAANAAKFRLRAFLDSGKSVGILFDNDALVAPGFEEEAFRIFDVIESEKRAIGTLYRSTKHPAKQEPIIDAERPAILEHVGGLSLLVTRLSAHHLLSGITWDAEWDWQLHKIASIYAPLHSYVEHIGRHGSGVNGESDDRAVNFLGYMMR